METRLHYTASNESCQSFMTQLSNFPAQLRGFPDISACAVRFFACIVPMKAAVRPDDPYILIIRLRRNGYAVRGSRYTIPNISDFTSASYFTATAHKFQLFLLIFFVLYDIWHRHGAYSGYRESCFFRYNPDIPFPTCLRLFLWYYSAILYTISQKEGPPAGRCGRAFLFRYLCICGGRKQSRPLSNGFS